MCMVDMAGMIFLTTVALPVALVFWAIVLWRIVLKMAGAKVRTLKSEFTDFLIGEN
ncbi:MAG: hypothetical protein ABEJ98_05155 [Candidatus Nanohaloarchaea archaeon]